jgi:hypothetical protein
MQASYAGLTVTIQVARLKAEGENVLPDLSGSDFRGDFNYYLQSSAFSLST